MQLHFTHELELSGDARSLLDFDVLSIRQMVAAAHDPEPTVWIADPEGYQTEGHVLRDSDAIRLIAYVSESGTVYATDGCNSCRHRPPVRIEKSSPGELTSLSEHTQLPIAMIGLLSGLVTDS